MDQHLDSDKLWTQDIRTAVAAVSHMVTSPLADIMLLGMIETSAEDSMCMYRLSIDCSLVWEG